MSSILKFAWSGAAVVLALVMAMGLLSQTVSAADATVVNVIIDEGNTAVGGDSADDDDTLVSNPGSAQAVQIVVDIDDGTAPVGAANEHLVTLTTSIGTFTNGATMITIQCANDGVNNGVVVVDDNDAVGTDSGTNVGITEGSFNDAAEGGAAFAGTDTEDAALTSEGCAGVSETLIIPAGAAIGTYSISASLDTGLADVDNLVIAAAVGGTPTMIAHTAQSHDSIGFTASGYTPWVNGTVWQVRVTDANGNGVTGRQVQFSAAGGLVLVAASTANTGVGETALSAISEAEVNAACTTTTTAGTTDIATTGTIGTTSTNTGRAQVVVCGTSAAGNEENTVTATVLGTSLAAATDMITTSNEPAQADLVVSITGNTITARLFKGTIPGPDDTAISFLAVPTTASAFAATCVELHDGVASTTFAVSDPAAQVLVTAIDDDDGTCGGTVGETWASSTRSLQATGTATATATPGACTGAIISGSIPRTGGFGLIVAGCGTIQQIETNTGCPIATMALWATRGGNFIVHVPGTTISAVNAEFFSVFPGGNIPANEPFVGKCV